MGMIGKAFGRALNGLIQYNSKISPSSRTARRHRDLYRSKKAVCQDRPCRLVRRTIPPRALQIPMNVGAPMKNAINQLPYNRFKGDCSSSPLLGTG